jgi:lipopolysaccharide export system permease protein
MRTGLPVFRIRTLDRYILRETAMPVLMSVVLITTGLLVINLLKLIELLVNHGAALTVVLKLLGLLIPIVLEQAIPIAVLIGTLIGIGRLSGDQELLAARACGISLYRLALPVVALAMICCPVILTITTRWAPSSSSRMRGLIYDLSRTSATSILSDKVFNRNLPGVTLYFEQADPSGTKLFNVLVSDARDRPSITTIVAKTATVIPSADGWSIVLHLSEGWNFTSGAVDDDQHFVRFVTDDINIDLRATLGQRKLAEFSMLDLRRAILVSPGKRNVWAETEIARRWTGAVAIFPLAIIGMILGLTRVRGGRSERMVMGILIFFLYHVVLRCVQAVAESGIIYPYFALILPSLILSILAIVGLHYSAMDLETPGREIVSQFFDWIEDRFKRIEA